MLLSPLEAEMLVHAGAHAGWRPCESAWQRVWQLCRGPCASSTRIKLS